jgi:acetoacetyl-CoA reductase
MIQQIAVVTGGTRGIGRAISEALKAQGHEVVAVYHGNDQAARMFEAETKIPAYKWDVGNFEACQKEIKEITQAVGPIDILVNNAGITRDSFLHKMDLNSWEEVIRINLMSCFNMTRGVIDSMRERSYGRIINIASVNAQKGQMGQTNYCAAKAAMIGFTKALALEGAAKKITVNAVAPGYIQTDMMKSIPDKVLEEIISHIPLKRLGMAEEVARVVAFLAHEQSSYITGETFNVNGGQYLQ